MHDRHDLAREMLLEQLKSSLHANLRLADHLGLEMVGISIDHALNDLAVDAPGVQLRPISPSGTPPPSR